MERSLVARSYMTYAQIGDPYIENGKKYILVQTPNGNLRKARVYSPDEWKRMYPDLASTIEDKTAADYRKILGFGEAGFITIYYGNTYDNLDWFKRQPECRYNVYFGWYSPSKETLSAFPPEGVREARIEWSDVTSNGYSIDPDKAKESVKRVIRDNAIGEYVGNVGDKIAIDLTVTHVSKPFGYYDSRVHTFKDEDGNILIWKTAARILEVGKKYHVTGTIKELDDSTGRKITRLTRCKVKDLDE